MTPSRLRAIVTGTVQGVGFRYSARSEGERLGLTGFVRNLPDGTVETQFEGADAATAAFAKWLRVGPPGAVVTGVDMVPLDPRAAGEERGFTILH